MFENPPRLKMEVPTFRTPQVSVKACTCASGTCPSHISPEPPIQPPLRRSRPASTTCFRPKTSVSAAVISPATRHEELKLSLTSLTSTTRDGTTKSTSEENEAMFRRWLAEKNGSKRRLEQERQLIEDAMLREQRHKLELERKNFASWLAAKRAEERVRIAQQREKCEQVDQRLGVERQHRQLESELSYQLWCKRKEQQDLERKLRQQVEQVREAEERNQRLQRNCEAYELWLQGARDRPRPLPPNRGLDSLRASVSVSYVNPTPWQPNIPHTQ